MTDSVFEFLNQYHLYMRLQAESAGLEWGKDAGRIKQIAAETDRMRISLDLPERSGAPEVGGLYWGCEDLCNVWIAGEVEPKAFAFHTIDFLMRELDPLSCFNLCTLNGLARLYGVKLVDELFDLADAAMASVCVEWRRCETTEWDDEREIDVPIFAALNAGGARFSEAPTPKCQPQDEGATQITIVSIDIDHFQGLGELIEERDRAARRAARGET